MPSQYVGISDDAGDKLLINTDGTLPISGTVSSFPTVNPAIRGSYVFSLGNITGIAAANNYMTLFNPLASGRVLSFGGAFVSSGAAGASSVTDPMQGFRITAASAGTLQLASAIAKFNNANPDATAEVRTGTVTATLAAQIFNSPPAISASVGSTAVHQVGVPPAAGPFVLAPGEGIALRAAAGDTDQRWNLSVVWVEF